MFLHFMTRDLRSDYPRIGWLPPLPNGAEDFWGEFSNLHAGEFPEILISQHDGEWKLYLSAINSGRTDSLSGGGRIIRISLFLTGTVGDSAGIVELISQFLHETLAKTECKPLLKELFQSRIKQGEPTQWSAAPMDEKEKIAAGLLEALSKLPPLELPSVALPPRWKGGCCFTNALDWFIRFCQKLLSGSVEGMGISLANLSYETSEVKRVLDKLLPSDHAAILLSTEGDKMSPIMRLPDPSVKSNGSTVKKEPSVEKETLIEAPEPTVETPKPPEPNVSVVVDTPIWKNKAVIATAIAVLILLIMLSTISGGKKQNAKVPIPQKINSTKR